MQYSMFSDRNRRPDDDVLREALGTLCDTWFELRDRVREDFDPVTEEWTYPGRTYGWSLRLKRRKRAILYLTPCASFIRVSFALGEKASAAALESGLPASITRIIRDADRYAEGRAVRIEIRDTRMLPRIIELAHIKMAH